MDKQSLTLEPRSVTGKKVKNLRKAGLIPASICGRGVQTQTFQLDAKTFVQTYQRVGRTGLIDLQMPNGTQSAFIRQVQMHPVSRQPIHVDFRIVDLNVEITADVPLIAAGQNPLVERGDAVLVMNVPTLHVKGLPSDLPQTIEVDISRLEDFHASLHVRDLDLGDKVQVLTPGDEVIASITPSRMEAEEEQITEQEQMGEPALHEAEDQTANEADQDE